MQQQRRRREEIVLIGDAADDTEFIHKVLVDNGISVPFTRLTDGSNALQYLSSNHAFVVLMLIDLDSRNHSGIDLLRRLRTLYPHIPVIIVSSDARGERMLECFQQGISAFLVKPAVHRTDTHIAQRNHV